MQTRSRRVRIAVVLALAAFAAFFAWRNSPSSRKPVCEPGRHEEKDSGGKVVKITHTTCVS